jgi:hypothetical protein
VRSSLVLFSALIALAATTGCGKVALDLDGLNPAALGPNALSNGAEFVSSSQNAKSINGYTPSTATGGAFSAIETTTANGYQVFSGVQGQEISDQVE